MLELLTPPTSAPAPVTPQKRAKPRYPLDIHPAALATMRRLAAGQPVRFRKPSAEWLREQFQKLYDDGSFRVPGIAKRARAQGLAVMYASLYGRVYHADGTVTDYGLLGRRVVTDAGVAFLASAFDNTVEPEILKYHGFGTGTTAESQTDTALVTELTTGYASANTRPTGSQAHGSGTHTGTYTTVGTLTPSADQAITEHGIFSVATSGSGTLWDRTKFAAINLVAANPDSLQSTYVLSLPSGS